MTTIQVCSRSFWLIFLSVHLWHIVSGHGKLVDPPGRNTVMNTQRGGNYLKQCNNGDINYSDKSNFCGGKGTQEANDGRCSACGDDWAAPYPRRHDYGGVFAKQIRPVRAYLQGQIITVKVIITASHMGYFEFRLCPKLEGEGADDILTQCYQDPSQYRLLQMTDGKTRTEGISQTMEYTYDLQLPKDINCAKGCSFQWWYKTGNSWGCDPDGSCSTGKGPQEHFVNCADILILTCEQYKSGRYPDWCAYGPTEELENCQVNGGSFEATTSPNTGSENTGYGPVKQVGAGEATGAGPGTGDMAESGSGIEPISSSGTDQGTGSQTDHPFLRVCYYSNWSQYRNSPGKFFPENIDPFLCTHLIYSFAKLQNNQLATYEWNDDQLYKRFNQLKEVNPSLKTLLAVGGWNFGSAPFSSLVASSSLRKHFAVTSVKFLRENGFDGLDLDWEYPAHRGGVPADKENLVLLLKDLKEQYEREHKETGRPPLLLTAAVASGKTTIDVAYDIPGMNKYLDFINLMAYDFHGSWEPTTGHNAPLKENDPNGQLNVDWAARYWRDQGTPANKLIIGLATYGRTFTLADPNNHEMGAPTRGSGAVGAGTAGQYTRESGFMAYYEICLKLARKEGIRKWDNERQVPFLVDGNQWIGYDDEESFTAKLRYIRENNYGGAMVWNMDLDDFQKICPQTIRNYPLMSLMKEVLENPNSGSTDKPSSSSSSWNEGSGGGSSTSSPNNEPSSTPDNANSETQNTGDNEQNQNGGTVWTPTNANNDVSSSNDDINDNNSTSDNNNTYDNSSTYDNNNNDDGGSEIGNNIQPENLPGVPVTISCATCYKNGQPYCDQCCERILTSEYKGTRPEFDQWCQYVCREGFCPKSHCRMSEARAFRQTCDIPNIPNISGSHSPPSCEDCQRLKSEVCDNHCCEKRITKTFKSLTSAFDQWCKNNCAIGFCPSSYCYTEEEFAWTDICVVALRNLKDILHDIERENGKKTNKQ